MSAIQSFEGLSRTKRQRKNIFACCLSWDICLLLPPDINTPGSQAFGVRSGLTSLSLRPTPQLECFVNSIPSHWSHLGKNRNLVRNVSPLYSLFLHLSRSEGVTLTAAMRLLNLDWVGCWMDPGFTKACQLDSQGYLLTDSALGP